MLFLFLWLMPQPALLPCTALALQMPYTGVIYWPELVLPPIPLRA